MKTVLCFGDSNTWGFVPGTDGARYPRGVRWPRVMEAALGGAVEVMEEGLCGRTTAFEDLVEPERSAYTQILPCVESHEPLDLIIIMLGTNDTKDRYCVNAQEIGMGMETLLRKLLGRYQFARTRPEVLVVAPPPVGNKPGGYVLSTATRAKSRMLALVFEPVATRLGCRFFDAAGAVGALGCDNVHLTEDNHRELGGALAVVVREILGLGPV